MPVYIIGSERGEKKKENSVTGEANVDEGVICKMLLSNMPCPSQDSMSLFRCAANTEPKKSHYLPPHKMRGLYYSPIVHENAMTVTMHQKPIAGLLTLIAERPWHRGHRYEQCRRRTSGVVG